MLPAAGASGRTVGVHESVGVGAREVGASLHDMILLDCYVSSLHAFSHVTCRGFVTPSEFNLHLKASHAAMLVDLCVALGIDNTSTVPTAWHSQLYCLYFDCTA